MGIFSRKKASTAQNETRAEAAAVVVADDAIVGRVAALMNDFNSAAGNDRLLRGVASDISSAAGLEDLQQTFGQPELLERPWRLLSAVAARATADGDHLLAARIFGFVDFWNTQITPLLRPGDWFELRLDRTPEAVMAEIATVGLAALRALPADQVVFHNQTGTMHAGPLVRAAAGRLLSLAKNGVSIPDAVLGSARAVLAE